jgi:hypothetical protein
MTPRSDDATTTLRGVITHKTTIGNPSVLTSQKSCSFSLHIVREAQNRYINVDVG